VTFLKIAGGWLDGSTSFGFGDGGEVAESRWWFARLDKGCVLGGVDEVGVGLKAATSEEKVKLLRCKCLLGVATVGRVAGPYVGDVGGRFMDEFTESRLVKEDGLGRGFGGGRGSCWW